MSIFYQDDFRDRQLLTLKLMLEQGKISDAEYEEALAQDMRASINLILICPLKYHHILLTM